MSRLEDTVAVVTGASSGIGEAIAEQFVAEGAIVTTASRSRPAVAESTWVPTDVADPAQVANLIDTVVAAHGRLDVLVNCAGVQVERTIADTTDAEFDHVMAVNVLGVFNCCREAVRAMRTRGGGTIINIGSTAATHADRGMAVYNASKGAVHALTRSIATDHGGEAIRCNTIAPGWIDTPLTDAAFDQADDPAAARAAAVARHPVGRLGTPDDVAALAVWLASDEAGFATGAEFTLDGGATGASPI